MLQPGSIAQSEVVIPSEDALLPGSLAVPARATGVVAFAHGSGSSRLSPRNKHVAQLLQETGLATLLFDLLTPEEELDRRNVFDISLLADRLLAATSWLEGNSAVSGLPFGYFGASTGAAAALRAAAESTVVAALVSRGGRPDLAGPCLADVRVPTLLIVGEFDEAVLKANRAALERIPAQAELRVVLGATHLFSEPEALDQVATLARDWFVRHLPIAPHGH